MSTSSNNPVTRHVLKYKGSGNVQVFQNLPTMLNGPKDGSDVGTGPPSGLAILETATAAGTFAHNRNIEFLDDSYVLVGCSVANVSGVFKRNAGGAGQWGQVQYNNLGRPFADGSISGLHIIHPDGIPTLCYMLFETGAELHFYFTADGLTGPSWGAVDAIVETNGATPASYGQSIVFRNSIFWAHQHFSGGAGFGSITQYDLENTTLTRYSLNGIMETTQVASNYSLHVHDNTLFVFGWDSTVVGGGGGGGDPGRYARIIKLQAGSFQTVWTSTAVQWFNNTIDGHAGMFTDPDTGNLVVFIHGADPVTGNSDIQVVSIANATKVPNVTDITTTVLGPGLNPTSGDGAEKYRLSAVDWRRRWSIFVDSEADPLNPRTFLTTWNSSGGFTETWEWQGIDTDMCAVESGGIQEGISQDFALPYVTATGGERSPQTGSIELEGIPERAIGGTKFEFRGRRDASGIVTFYGDDGLGAGTPEVQLPIIAGSLEVGAGMLTNLEAYYHMEGSGGRTDFSGNGLNLLETGTVGTGSGIFGLGADFPGTAGNFLNRGVDDPSLDIGQNQLPFSVQAWITTNDLSDLGADRREVCGKSDTSTNGWVLSIRTEGTVHWRQEGTSFNGTGTLTSPPTEGTVSITAGLQHIVVTSDGKTTRIYLDGSEIASAASVPINNSATQFIVGARQAAPDAMWDGIIDEVAIWSRYLTLAEVTALYNVGSGKLLTDITALPTTPSISGNTIVDFVCDNGATLYSVILDAANAGIVPGAPGIIMADLTQLG